MRGEKEKKCLDFIISYIFYKDKNICKDFFGKTYKDVSDKTFKDNWVYYVSDYFHDYSFGLFENDEIEITDIFRKVKENKNSNDFPDFVFDKGFIEHFQITSSKTTNKGAKQIKEEKLFNKEVYAGTKKFIEECNEEPSFNKVRSKYWEFEPPKHSYEYLVESFKNNWENHIKSLNNYAGNKDFGIFVLDYREFALNMIEKIAIDGIDGMSCGDLFPTLKECNYRLSRDKKLLDYVYTFKDKLKYVIFVHYQGIEIIKIENIPYFKKLMPYDYEVSAMFVRGFSAIHNISLKNNTEDNKNDET